MADRVICKHCKRLIYGICEKYKRRRSPGRKRVCVWFDAKPRKMKVIAPYFRFMSKADKTRLRKQNIEARKKHEAHQREVEQRKLMESALVRSKAPQEKINIKKPGLFKRLFNRQKIF